MRRHRLDSSFRSDAYDTRWYFAPVSVVVVGLAALQFVAGGESSPAQSAETPTTTLSAEFPVVVEPLAVPPDVARAAPASAATPGAGTEVTASTDTTENDYVATF